MTIRRKINEKAADWHAAKAHLTDATMEVKKQALEASDEMVGCIKRKPVQSVLIASLVGLLVGKFLL